MTPGTRGQFLGSKWDDNSFASMNSLPRFSICSLYPTRALCQTQEPCHEDTGLGMGGGPVGRGDPMGWALGEGSLLEGGIDRHQRETVVLGICLFNYLSEWIAFLSLEEIQI